MRYVDLYFFEESSIRTTEDHECEQYELMQYTGIKDEDGRDIYEGDIVQWYDTYREPQLSVIDWSAEGAGWRIPGWRTDNKQGFQRMKIVGNIYETPQLLATDQPQPVE